MSYNDSVSSSRLMGEYVGKVLKGDNLRYAGFRGGVPQSEIWINMKTAKTLGLNVPRSLLQCAKGVIE